MVVAPVLYMVKEGMKEALESFVKNGGILITTYMSGIVDQSDNVHLGGYPGPVSYTHLAKISRHTSKNAITEGDFKCIFARNCEGTEQLHLF